jgi:hypothetical protein
MAKTKQTPKPGILSADRLGFFRLYTVSFDSCWHWDTPCDGTCATAGDAVPGFKPTNAFWPATVRAINLGYTDAYGEW